MRESAGRASHLASRMRCPRSLAGAVRVQVFIAYLAGISERADLKLLYDAFAKLLNNPLQVPPARHESYSFYQ